MSANTTIHKPEFGYRSINIFNDSITKRKIQNHLVDINDKITEDDIRNIKVSIPETIVRNVTVDEKN